MKVRKYGKKRWATVDYGGQYPNIAASIFAEDREMEAGDLVEVDGHGIYEIVVHIVPEYHAVKKE